MTGSPERRALLQIHFCVLLWGFTAILGKLISLPALELVWWRMLIVVAVLLAWPPLWRELRAAATRTLAVFAGIGVVVSLHWGYEYERQADPAQVELAQALDDRLSFLRGEVKVDPVIVMRPYLAVKVSY